MNVKKTLAKILKSIEIRELVWTNPNPSANFAPQTIQLVLNGFDAVEIIYKEASGYGGSGTIPRRHNIDGVSTPMFANTNRFMFRNATVSTNGITFSGASYYTTYGGNATAAENGFLVPCKIYGIRKLGGGTN